MWNGKGKEESKMISRFLAQEVTGCIARAIYCNKKHTEIAVGRSSLAENILCLEWLLDSKVEIS